MKIERHKNFKKQYQKLPIKHRMRVDSALVMFMENPMHPLLRNHLLTGKLKGLRSISVGFDLRIVFQERDNFVYVLLIAVGSHAQVY